MRKYHLLLGLAFFLLLISPVESALFNLTSYPDELYEDNVWGTSNGWVRNFEAVFDESNKRWYLAVSRCENAIYISKWNENLTTKEDGWDRIVSDDRPVEMQNYNSSHLIIAYVNTTPSYSIVFVKKDDLSTSVYAGSSASAQGSFGMAEDYTIAHVNTYIATQTLNFTLVNGSSYDATCSICDQGNVTDIHLIKEGDEYWLFARAGVVGSGINTTSSKAYVSRYAWDSADNRYEETGGEDYWQISTGYVLDVHSGTTGTGKNRLRPGSMDVKKRGEYIYVATREAEHNQNNNTLWLRIIDIDAFKHGQILAVGEESHDLGDYDSSLNESYHFSGIGIGYNSDDGMWNIFYAMFNASAEPSGTVFDGFHNYALKSYSGCACSDWINVSGCGDRISGYQKQMRSCNPDLCNNEIQYIDCEEKAPTIKYKLITKCEPCNPATKLEPPQQLYASKHTSANCQVYVDIPENVTNVTSTAYWSVYAEKELLFGLIDISPENNFTASMCNPLTTGNCVTYKNLTCRNDYNFTFSLDYNSYQAGQQASADFSISGVSACHSGLTGGWDEYYMAGDLCVYWSQFCGGYHCKYVAGKWYEELEDEECNPVNSTYCPLGCDFDTGRCKTSTITEELLEGDPFDLARQMAESTFSSWVLVVLSVGITGGTTVLTAVETKKWQIALAIGCLFALVFLIMGWLPAIIGVLWIFTVAVIFMKGVFLKGD